MSPFRGTGGVSAQSAHFLPVRSGAALHAAQLFRHPNEGPAAENGVVVRTARRILPVTTEYAAEAVQLRRRPSHGHSPPRRAGRHRWDRPPARSGPQSPACSVSPGQGTARPAGLPSGRARADPGVGTNPTDDTVEPEPDQHDRQADSEHRMYQHDLLRSVSFVPRCPWRGPPRQRVLNSPGQDSSSPGRRREAHREPAARSSLSKASGGIIPARNCEASRASARRARPPAGRSSAAGRRPSTRSVP